MCDTISTYSLTVMNLFTSNSHKHVAGWGVSVCPTGRRRGNHAGNTGALALLPVIPGAQRPGRNPYETVDPEALQDLLRRTENELEEERRKSSWLMTSFLPPTIARQITAGQEPDAGKWSQETDFLR